MSELIRKFFLRRFGTSAQKIIRKALECKTLADLITLQPIVILKYPHNSTRFAGRRLTVIEYLRRAIEVEIIAPRISVKFFPVPTTDTKDFPMYSLFMLINDIWYNTQLLAVIERGSSYPAIVHQSQHFGTVREV